MSDGKLGRRMWLLALVMVFSPVLAAQETAPVRLPRAAPSEAGMDPARLAEIDAAVEEAIQDRRMPGAVVAVVRQGKLVFLKGYGKRSLSPAEEPMTTDTLFDLASLTKPIATATSIMILIEEGKVRLEDPVSLYLPGFEENGKDKVTVEELLTHTAGFIADNPIRDYEQGKDQALERIKRLAPVASPGSRFIYSDVGFITLGAIVEKVSGQPLDQFAARRVFVPLGMTETGYRPAPDLARRAAPAEKRGDRWMKGEVHDPRAFHMGGVAGHAGLFSTAEDLAVYAQAILNGGEYAGRRVLKPETVRLMTTPRLVPGGRRALGWDVQTSFSSNRGERFSRNSFGHTGFTGTSIWIDPPSQTAVIFLSNRVHPDGKGNVTRVRGQVATLVAAAISQPPFPEGGVLTGIDVLKRDGFQRLKGKKIGLVTNHTGLDRDGQSTIDLLHQAEGVSLIALFSPEHGIRGQLDERVGDSRDEKTGLPVYSLYGERRKPTAEQLRGIDTLVYDIQDVGCRFYTYSATLGLILETAAEHQLKVVVLDRPNPIGGLAVAGPVLDPGRESFTGYHTIPVRHGMTLGELALLFNQERKIGAPLEVVRVEGWQRADFYDRTGLVWVNPSPNMRSLTEALLYPGIGLLETTNLSVGRGTDRPFEIIGAPWLDGRRLAAELARASLPGVRFVPARFTPASSVHAGKACGGVHILVDDWQKFEPLRTGVAIACALRKLYPSDWQTKRYLVLLANQSVHAALERGDPPQALEKLWQPDLEKFQALRKAYLLYP